MDCCYSKGGKRRRVKKGDTTLVRSDHFLPEDYVQGEKIARARLVKHFVSGVFNLVHEDNSG